MIDGTELLVSCVSFVAFVSLFAALSHELFSELWWGTIGGAASLTLVLWLSWAVL